MAEEGVETTTGGGSGVGGGPAGGVVEARDEGAGVARGGGGGVGQGLPERVRRAAGGQAREFEVWHCRGGGSLSRVFLQLWHAAFSLLVVVLIYFFFLIDRQIRAEM